MAEGQNPVQGNQISDSEIETRIGAALNRAAEVISGTEDIDPLEVFPDPKTADRRMDVVFDSEDLTEQQETGFRAAMAELGIGRLTNRGAEACGLMDGYTSIIEGGLGHKMMAELNVVMSDATSPGVIVIAATTHREVKDDEREVTARILGVEEETVGDDEYDVAMKLVTSLDGFVAEEFEVLNCGYTMDGEIVEAKTGQFVQIGTLGYEIPVIMMHVDREYSEDGSSFKQLSNLQKMTVVGDIVGSGTDIGFVTSSTYQPSLEIDAARAIKRGHRVAVPTYGMEELAKVKGDDIASPPKLNQLAGEAFKAAHQLSLLVSEKV